MMLLRWALACLCLASLYMFPGHAAGWVAAAILMGLYAVSVSMRLSVEEEKERERGALLQRVQGWVQLLESLAAKTETEEEGEVQEQNELAWLSQRILRGINALAQRSEAAEGAVEAAAAVVKGKELEASQLQEALVAARRQVDAAGQALARERGGWEEMCVRACMSHLGLEVFFLGRDGRLMTPRPPTPTASRA